MANHEINITCKRCELEFDARTYGTICPRCFKQNAFAIPKVSRGNEPLFHIPDAALTGAGFKKSILHDSDGEDKYRIETFNRAVAESLSVEVTFGYQAKAGDAPYELIDSFVELRLGDEGVKLATNTLADIIRLADTLTKSIKLRKYAARCS